MDYEVEEILRKYNVSLDEVKKWVIEKYGEKYTSNLLLATFLYLRQVKKIEITFNRDALMAKSSSIAQMKKEASSSKKYLIKAIIINEINRRDYVGCPVCFKKAVEGVCPNGHMEETKQLSWVSCLIGDETDIIVADITPRITLKQSIKEGGKYEFYGRLKDNNTFIVNSMVELEEGTTTSTVEEEIKVILETTDDYNLVKQYCEKQNIPFNEETLKKMGYEVRGGKVVKL
jgi:hypothetical protein